MKFLKKLAVLCASFTLCLSVAAFAACGGSTQETSSPSSTTSEVSSETPAAKGYTFKVLNADGTPATGWQVQLCLTSGACLQGSPVDANGIAVCDVDKTESYTVHVWSADYSVEKQFTGISEIPANYDGGVIEITLK